MATELEIRAQPEGLVLRATRAGNFLDTIFLSVASCGFAGYVAHYVAPVSISVLAGALGAWLGYRYAKGPKTIVLKATNLEFQTDRRLWLFGPSRSVPRAVIVDLEYRPPRGGDVNTPGGLYATLKFGRAACLMADLDERETYAAILALYDRFPDMPLAEERRQFGDHYTTLDL